MNISDWIQAGALVVAAISLVAVVIQLRLQRKLMMAQFLRDQFEMYWRLYEPMAADAVEWMESCPEDYMPVELYEQKYRGNVQALKKYAGMAEAYEFLAFRHRLYELKIPDPMGFEWTKRWAQDLACHEEFREVNSHYGSYYPRFSKFVDSLVKDKPLDGSCPVPPPLPPIVRPKAMNKKRRSP